MTANSGFLTTLSSNPTTWLDDGTDKLHSGILQSLFTIASGNYVYTTGGINQAAGSARTQFTLNTTGGELKWYLNNERRILTSSIAVELNTDPHATYDRYDML